MTRSYFTEDFDAEAYLEQLRSQKREINWIIRKGGLAVFMPVEIWHFARNMGHSSCNLDYGVEMHRLGSGRGYWDYLFVIVTSRTAGGRYIDRGVLHGELTRIGHLSLQREEYEKDHVKRQKALEDETAAFRRLWSEELASCWKDPNRELQRMYYNHWSAEYRRIKQDAKLGGWKLDYDMPI